MFCNIRGGLCAQVFYSLAWSKRWLEVICVVKSKAIQPQPKYKTRNPVRKRSLRGIHETKSKLEFHSATWSHNKHHKTAEFCVCVFSNSTTIIIWCQTKVQVFWWIRCWMCKFVPSGRIVYPFFLRGQENALIWHHNKFT